MQSETLPGSRAASDHNGRMALQSACNQRRYPEAVPLRIITVGWHCTPKHVANVRLVALGLAFAATAPCKRRNASAASAAASAAAARTHPLAPALARTLAGWALPFLEPNLRKPESDDET